MNIVKSVSVIFFLISLAGCATLKDMYDYDYTKDQDYWSYRASFYYTHYPEASESEKISMLVEEMRKSGIEPKIEIRETREIHPYVFNPAGEQIWPVKSQLKKRGH